MGLGRGGQDADDSQERSKELGARHGSAGSGPTSLSPTLEAWESDHASGELPPAQGLMLVKQRARRSEKAGDSCSC